MLFFFIDNFTFLKTFSNMVQRLRIKSELDTQKNLGMIFSVIHTNSSKFSLADGLLKIFP